MDAPSSSSSAATAVEEAAAATTALVTVAVEKLFKPALSKLWNNFIFHFVAPSIFNIKARGLAHCLHWMKLNYYEVYEVHF